MWVQPTERYRFEEQTAIRRRDMRRGEQTCLAKADSGKVEVDMQWGSPCAGTQPRRLSALQFMFALHLWVALAPCNAA